MFAKIYRTAQDIVFVSLIRENIPRMMQNHMSCLLKQKMGSLVWQHSTITTANNVRKRSQNARETDRQTDR